MRQLTIQDKTVPFARRLKLSKPQLENDILATIAAPIELYKQMWLGLPQAIILHQWLGQAIKEMGNIHDNSEPIAGDTK